MSNKNDINLLMEKYKQRIEQEYMDDKREN